MGSKKDRNGKDITEAEEIKKWQEYTEELYKKGLNDLDNHDDVVTELQSDILDCEVKCALGSITMNKSSGGDGIPTELFKILKDNAVQVLHSICQWIWKIQQTGKIFKIQQIFQDWKMMSVFVSIPNKGNAKEYSNFCTIESTSHTSKVTLKIILSKLQQYVNWEIPDVQPRFRKGRGTRDQIANICWIIEKAREFQKNCFID